MDEPFRRSLPLPANDANRFSGNKTNHRRTTLVSVSEDIQAKHALPVAIAVPSSLDEALARDQPARFETKIRKNISMEPSKPTWAVESFATPGNDNR